MLHWRLPVSSGVRVKVLYTQLRLCHLVQGVHGSHCYPSLLPITGRRAGVEGLGDAMFTLGIAASV